MTPASNPPAVKGRTGTGRLHARRDAMQDNKSRQATRPCDNVPEQAVYMRKGRNAGQQEQTGTPLVEPQWPHRGGVACPGKRCMDDNPAGYPIAEPVDDRTRLLGHARADYVPDEKRHVAPQRKIRIGHTETDCLHAQGRNAGQQEKTGRIPQRKPRRMQPMI